MKRNRLLLFLGLVLVFVGDGDSRLQPRWNKKPLPTKKRTRKHSSPRRT